MREGEFHLPPTAFCPLDLSYLSAGVRKTMTSFRPGKEKRKPERNYDEKVIYHLGLILAMLCLVTGCGGAANTGVVDAPAQM